jgi:hypothetical protein
MIAKLAEPVPAIAAQCKYSIQTESYHAKARSREVNCTDRPAFFAPPRLRVSLSSEMFSERDTNSALTTTDEQRGRANPEWKCDLCRLHSIITQFARLRCQAQLD